ncbi:MAG: DUF1553 domain-containing protein, partial [Pirellulaceae bacterium]|nr:DUF1553 domain-containing protein [Pirellulaceae bacterium]
AASHTQKTRLREKTLEVWVRLDGLKQRGGSAMTVHHKSGAFDAIVFGEREPGKWMPGSDFHKRTKNLDAPPETEAADSFVHLAISYHADGAIACFRNGEPYGKPYPSDGPQLYDPGEWYVMFGLRNGGPAAQRQLRGLLETAQLYNRALSAEQVRASFDCEQAAITHNSILAALTNDERKRREELHSSLVRLIEQRKQHEARSVYVVAAEKPKTAFVLHRGNPAQRREQVAPGGVAALAGKSPHFQLAVDAGDSERRRELASWITSELNPLFSRVIVNRLWHYHFGSGIVETPNDFGFNGGRPSHPQLLDWLAAELVKSDWSLKHIHRLIVTSGVYLQSSRFREAPSRVDANNRSLWRMNPQRLEAEALRDSILHVSGQLNRQYGGPPYRDFKTFVNNTQFYEIIDPDTPDAYRRTVYRAWIRSGRSPLLDAFDCPDPSTTAPRRAVTTTPVQSLALLNNSFVLRMADRFADRVAKVAGDDAARQADSVYRFAYGRSPAPTELEPLTTFIAEHGLPAFCRVVFNSNEFIHVD